MESSFPFEVCSSKNYTRIYIFGAGVIGSNFQKQLDEQDEVTNLGFIDNFVTTDTASAEVAKVGVYKPEFLRDNEDVNYDCIVLACSYNLIPEICETLFSVGVDFKKIVMPTLMKAPFFTPDIKDDWNYFYEHAEIKAVSQVEKFFVPIITKRQISLNRVLDFPSGRGRIAEVVYNTYAESVQSFTCCDINSEAISYCRERFADNKVFDYIINKVDELECIPLEFKGKSFTFIYSWDAMVHFSYKWLDFYISEFFRILDDGGYVLIHHSNLGSPDVEVINGKSENWYENPHYRTPVSAKDIKLISERCGFTVVEQICIDWEGVPDLDCITLLKK